MADHDSVYVQTADTASQLLEWLSPRGQFFRDTGPYEWLFRGHGDARFELVPTALRPEKRSRLLKSSVAILPDSPDTNGIQFLAEANLLHEFLDVANDTGLPIPGIDPAALMQLGAISDCIHHGNRDEMASRVTTRFGWRYWPPIELLSLMAIARHSRLLTRVLDWTYSPTTAAYFAAASEVRKIEDPANRHIAGSLYLSVWAVHRFAANDFPHHGHVIQPNDFCLLQLPYEPNRNMFAQSGALTIVPLENDKFSTPTDRRSIDKIISAGAVQFVQRIEKKCNGLNLPVPQKTAFEFRLPWDKAHELLCALFCDRISHNRMYPSYEGVVAAMDERLVLMQYSSRKR